MIGLWVAIVGSVFSLLTQHSKQGCTAAQAPFPKIVGGTQGHTKFFQIDYNKITGHLAAAGMTEDQGLRGDSSGAIIIFPIIVVYSPPSFSYAWGKYFNTMSGKTFHGVSTNKMGTQLVVANAETNRNVIVMDLIDGTVISATTFTASGSYSYDRRNLLLLNNGIILMGENTLVIKVTPSTTSAPSYSLAGYSTIGIRSNEAQTNLQIFSYIISPSKCMITVAELTTFTNIYQYQAQCQSGSAGTLAETFQTCSYEISPTVDTIVFQEGTRFFRVSAQYSPLSSTTAIIDDPSAQSLIAKGLHCASPDLVYSLMYGVYSTFSSRMFVAEVNFMLNKITYRRYLQTLTNVMHGVIADSRRVFITANENLAYKATSLPIFSSSYDRAIIYSLISTCQQFDEIIVLSVFPPANTLTILLTTLALAPSSPITLAASPYTTSSLVSSLFEQHYVAECGAQIAQAPHDYSALSSTQTNSNYYYLETEASKSFGITGFTASVVGSATAPLFSYKLESFNGPVSGVSINSGTGEITVPDTSLLGLQTYEVIIEGKLQDCQTITASFSITGLANTPPSFQGILGSNLPDLSIQQGQTTSYLLPAIFDPDSGQSLSITINDVANIAYPAFVDFTDSTHTAIKVEPTFSTPVATYPIQLNLYDGFATALYYMNIVVEAYIPPLGKYVQTNQGPPLFNSSLETIVLKIGDAISYTLPAQIDPDNDKISIFVDLKEALTFTSFKNGQFRFKPMKGQKYKQMYEIVITLTDDNANPKVNTVKLSVIIEKSIVNAKAEDKKDDEIINDKVMMNSYKCGIRIMQVTRSGQLRLKITSSSNSAANSIAKNLKESDLIVSVKEYKDTNIRIEKVLQGNILSIQLSFNDSDKISSDMELDKVHIKIARDIFSEFGKAMVNLPKSSSASAAIPLQYTPSNSNFDRYPLFRSRAISRIAAEF
ncbi:hypothetical protein FGO68_gene1228 [Halteria grandinella]|uniref:Cadherin domain-containing protein n=1 Tax=Halteria grandinella TaxID=5974 RepID=A0A8J8T8F6_HALGN|nr:hypothetical protein FGO68_gene1228 [Halteria grandinella]